MRVKNKLHGGDTGPFPVRRYDKKPGRFHLYKWSGMVYVLTSVQSFKRWSLVLIEEPIWIRNQATNHLYCSELQEQEQQHINQMRRLHLQLQKRGLSQDTMWPGYANSIFQMPSSFSEKYTTALKKNGFFSVYTNFWVVSYKNLKEECCIIFSIIACPLCSCLFWGQFPLS